MSRVAKEGISTDEKNVRVAVQQVMQLLFKGRSDTIGEFKETSKSGGKQICKNSTVTPPFYIELEKYFKSRLFDDVIIVSISSSRLSDLHKGDLKLTSRDLNCCDFSFLLASCLTQDFSTIYIECSNLNKRGLKRLLAILKDMKMLFDNRVHVILLSEASIAQELKQISERDFSSGETVPKRAKTVESAEELERETKELELKEIKTKLLDLSEKNKELSIENNSLERKAMEYKNNLETKFKEYKELSLELENLKLNHSHKESIFENNLSQ